MSAAAPPGLNIANALTVLRLVLVPVFAVLLLWDGGASDPARWLALGVFVAAAWTDRVDGRLARERGLVTRFGTLADPIADKALTGAGLVCLSLLGELPWWVTALIVVRELGITLLRLVVIRHGVMPASRGGKWKTALQGLALGLYVLPVDLGAVPEVAMGVAVVVTVVTALDYVVRAVALRRGSERTAAKQAARTSR